MSSDTPPLPPAAGDADLAGVLDKLQQVGELDPAAQQTLIDQLRQTDPKFWPAVAEQFRSSLAYHNELKSTSRHSTRTNDTEARPQEIPQSTPSALQRNAIAAAPVPIPSVPSPTPPSTLIGTLPDPRRAEADGISSEAMARTSPYAQKLRLPDQDTEPTRTSVPANFESETNSYPIAAERRLPPPDSAPSAVRPAAYTEAARRDAANPDTGTSDKDWQQLVVAAADELSRHVAASPATTAEVHQHVSLRILRLLAGQTEEALQPIPHISPVEQDYWSRQVFALATYLDHHSQPDDKRRAAASVTHLDEAVANLRDLGALALRNFTFCKNIYGYGAVEPYTEDRFSAGQQVSLYVEVENYHSQSTDKGFTTSLGSTYEILDEKGERVDGGEFPDVDDCCRSRRRDFHIQFGLTLPKAIQPGRYRLELVVRDRQSDKIAHATAAFEIRGNSLPAPTNPRSN